MWAIREASVADAQALALIGSATFLETFAGILDGGAIVAHCLSEHSPEAYIRYLETGGRAWLAETDDGKAPVGFALVSDPDLPGSAPGDLELKRIYTLSRFHGTGMGSALLSDVLAHAERKRAVRLLLGVYAGNERARAFYIKNGFGWIADRQFLVGDRHYDDVVLARPLVQGEEAHNV